MNELKSTYSIKAHIFNFCSTRYLYNTFIHKTGTRVKIFDFILNLYKNSFRKTNIL